MSHPGNPFDGIFRTLNWRSQSLIAATLVDGTRVNVPFIGNTTATNPVLSLGAANHMNVQFIARDANGNIETQPVVVAITGATGTVTPAIAGGAAGGVLNTSLLTALGAEVSVTPNATTGLVSLDVTVGTAQLKNVLIRTRHVTAAGSITVA